MAEDAGTLFERLVEIMRQLRGPDGCPWDREQTRDSLKPFLIEEAYEVLEALEGEDLEKFREELGDLLFQIIFHAQIAEEGGEFSIQDVIRRASEKITRRHPHVFANAQVANAQEVLFNWEEIKRAERPQGRSVLEGVPRELPALLRAHRLQDRAARVGFDWKNAREVMGKVEEEMAELKRALMEAEPSRMEEELGDLLFALVNLSRFLEVNPEEALRKTISRFISRFRYIEEEMAKRGRPLREVTLEEMDRLWEEAKAQEG